METKDKIILISILVLQAIILFVAYHDTASTERTQTITIKINNQIISDDDYSDYEEETTEI